MQTNKLLTWLRPPAILLAALLLAACSNAIDVPTPEEVQVKQITYGTIAAVDVSWREVLRADGYLLHYDDDQSGAPYTGSGLGVVRWPGGCGKFDGAVAMTSLDLSAGTLDSLLAPEDGDAGPLGDGSTPDAGSPDAGSSGDASLADAGPSDGSASDAAPPEASLPDSRPPDVTADRGQRDGPWPGFAADSPIRIEGIWCLDREDTYSDAGMVPTMTPGTRPVVRLQGLVAGRTYYFAVQAFRRDSLSALSAEVNLVVADKPGK